jgi:hypothetical protein
MKTHGSPRERGVALMIVMAALLLVTAVAAGMILLTNTETNVDSNYRDEQIALFAAKAGLQEARDRMLASNASPISFSSLILPTTSSSCPASAYAAYIVASGISPWSNSVTQYYDTEFLSELSPLSGFPGCSTWYTSTGRNSGYSGPSSNPVPYQWVRINLKLDQSAYSSGTPYYVDGNSSNATKEVFYDATNGHDCVAGTGTCATSSNLLPVYEITSYALTQSGTHRMLQDEVAAQTFNLNFPSTLTIPGPIGSFNPASSNNYCIDGYDGGANVTAHCKYTAPPAVPGCSASATGGPSIGVTAGNDSAGTQTNQTYVTGQISRTDHYMGSTGGTPSVGNVALPSFMSTPAALDQEVQLIQQNANVSLVPSTPPGSYSWSDITNAMPGSAWTNSNDNPQVIYVDGNLDISSQTGSGILVVTGNLTYDGNSGWNGIILVVGDGTTTYSVSGGGNGQFNGAIVVATTKDSHGNELSSFGSADYNISGGGGSGVYYNSCWVNSVQSAVSYRVLSTKEISH